MTERSYQDAVQVLKHRLGGRWEGFATDGRDEMVAILKDELGYDETQADDAIDAMVASGTLHYHEAGAAIPPVATAGPGLAEGGAVPMVVPPAAGYWQIGEGEEISDSTSRKGQIDPM